MRRPGHHPRVILEKGKPGNLSDTREPRSAAQKSASSPPTPYSRARGDAFPIRRRLCVLAECPRRPPRRRAARSTPRAARIRDSTCSRLALERFARNARDHDRGHTWDTRCGIHTHFAFLNLLFSRLSDTFNFSGAAGAGRGVTPHTPQASRVTRRAGATARGAR